MCPTLTIPLISPKQVGKTASTSNGIARDSVKASSYGAALSVTPARSNAEPTGEETKLSGHYTRISWLEYERSMLLKLLESLTIRCNCIITSFLNIAQNRSMIAASLSCIVGAAQS